MAQPTSDNIFQTIQEKLAKGQYSTAQELIQHQLTNSPEEPQLHYMAAVCFRYLAEFSKAQHHLDIVKVSKGDRGRGYQEQGYLYLAQQQFSQALKAFATATQTNPALIPAWKAISRLSQQLGHTAQADFADQQLRHYSSQPKPIIAVIDLIAQGKTLKAEALCRKFLKVNPTHIEGMRLLADIGTRLGELDDAEFLLESAAQLAPDNILLNIDYIQILRKRHQYQKALKTAEALFKKTPLNAQVKSVYAIEKMQMADYKTAVDLFDEVLEQIGNDPITLTSRGHALKTWGKSEEAIASYQNALSVNVSHGEAWYSLANLKTYKFNDQQLAVMKEQEKDADLGSMHRVQLNFALGKAFEDKKDYEQSFKHYQAGNSIKRLQSGYDADKMHAELAEQRQFFTEDTLASISQQGCKAPDPIFIVGLPRAGSTLLEQILASHSQVDGTLELPNILSLAQKLRREGYPSQLANFSRSQLQALGQKYLDETRVHRQSAPFFIDKMPNNFRHIGLIKLILPNAKIIDARRSPMSCCFSGFKQLFAEGQEFSYSLEDIGRYYRDYIDLMNHWQSVFPKQILLMQYEDVVEDTENQVKRLLDYCGLPFEEACLAFHKNDRAVRTASSEQVRQPIYSSSLDVWENYQSYLGPLKDALQEG